MQSSIDRLEQKIEERDPLLPSGGRDRQAALGEALTHLTPGPEASFAPEHGGTDGLLGLVVRGVDSFHLDEGPEVLPQPVQFEGERLGLGVAAFLGHVQHLGVTRLDQAHAQTQAVAAQDAVPVLAMQSEHPLRLGHAPCASSLRSGMLPLGDGAPVPQQVGMADAPPLERGVRGPAVAHDYPGVIIREDYSPCFVPPASMQLEDRGFPAADCPEPSLLSSVPPTRFVGMDHGLGEYLLGDLLEGRCEGMSGLFAESLDAAHGEAQAECIAQDGAEFPSGKAVAAAEHGDEGCQPGAELPLPDTHRKLGACGLAAVLAAAPVQLVLDHHGKDRRKVRDLVADGLADHGLVSREVGLAVLAGTGQMRDNAIGVVDHGAVRAFVPRLTTRFSFAGFLGGGLRGSRRIGRRRGARVRGIAVEPGLQILDTRQQDRHRLLQRSDRGVAHGDSMFKFGNTQVARISLHAPIGACPGSLCRGGLNGYQIRYLDK